MISSKKYRLALAFLFAVSNFTQVFAEGLEWEEVACFDSGSLPENAKVKCVGTATAEIEKTEQPYSGVLCLSLNEGVGKLAMLAFNNIRQLEGNQPLIVSMDLNVDSAVGGYKKGFRFGRGDLFIDCGRYGISNHDGAIKGKVFLGKKTAPLSCPFNGWLHFQLEIFSNKQMLIVYEYDNHANNNPAFYATKKPLVQLECEQNLARSGNALILFNGNPFSPDMYKQARGAVRFDNIQTFGGSRPAESQEESVTSLSNRLAKVDISSTTGAIKDLTGLGEPLLRKSADEYYLHLRDKELLSSEKYDEVTNITRVSASHLDVECFNSELNIGITKSYVLERDRLIKKTTITSAMDIDGFLTVRPSLSFADSYRIGGLYHTIKGWDVQTHYAAKNMIAELRLGHPLANTGNQMLCFVNPTLGITVGEFLYKVDDHFVWPQNFIYKEITAYTMTGWRYPAFMFHPEVGISRSCENHIVILKGDQMDFHKKFQQMPEVAEMIGTVSPEWVNKSKIDIVNWYSKSPCEFSKLTQGLVDSSKYTDDEYAICTQWGWATWGEMPIDQDEQIVIARKNKQKVYKPTQWFVNQMDLLKKECPSVKYGLYHFLTSLAPATDFGERHADWQAIGPDGKMLPQPEPGWTAAYRILTAEGSLEHMYAGFAKQFDRYDTDFIYIDGGSKSISNPDWRRMRADQGYVFVDMWKKTQEIARAKGSGRAVFYNYFAFPYGDIGYLEIGSLKKVYKENWRQLAEMLLVAKSYQRPGHDYTGILYRTLEPAYSNMILALGLRPTGAEDPNMVPNWSHLFGYLPYINAAFELKDSRYINAIVSPKFWLDVGKNSDIQATTLKQGNGVLVSVINHGTETQFAEIEIDLEKTGLEINKPIYIWHQKVIPSDFKEASPIEDPCDPVEVERVVETRFVKKVELAGNLLRQTLEIDSEKLTYVLLSNSPAVITAVGYRDTQIWLPEMLGVKTDVAEVQNGFDLSVDNATPKATIKVFLPNAHESEKIEATGGYQNKTIQHDGEMVVMSFDCTEGRTDIKIRF